MIQIPNQPVANRTNPFQVNQLGNFKELIVGAGSTIAFKANREGCFSGSYNYTNAPLKWNNAGVFRCTGAYINGEITATGGSITGDLTVTGSLLSDDGSEFQTKLLLGKISFLKSGVEKSFIKTPSGSNGLQIATGEKIYFTNLLGATIAELWSSDKSLQFAGDSYIKWSSGRKITADASNLTVDGGLIVDNTAHTAKVASNGFNIYGGADGDNGTSDFITALDLDGSTIKYKKRSITATNGIWTDYGDETDWQTLS